jgi:cobalamin biosynthesis protein CobT
MSVTILSSKSLLSSLDHFKQLILEYDQLLNENIELKQKMKEVEEVNKSFMSVSLIVNTKNENDKLRNELHLLKKRISYLENELKNKRSHVEEVANTSNNIQEGAYRTKVVETEIPVSIVEEKVEEEVEKEQDEVEEGQKDEEEEQEEEREEEAEEEEDEAEEQEEEEEEREEEEEEEREEEEQEEEQEEDEEEEEAEEQDEEEQEEEEEDEIELVEQEYEGKIYFVSDDHHKHIYDRIKTDNGDYEPSDDPIGYFKIVNGIEEAVWD